jgi:hypothetical protein
MKQIRLRRHDGGGFDNGVILLCDSGVSWETQAGGTACRHPKAEGIFIPLPLPAMPHVGCWGGFDPGDDEKIVESLVGLPLVLDRDRWSDGMEAWIPVIVSESDHDYVDLTSFVGMKGWLVYENCD